MRAAGGSFEPDPKLRDFENVPLRDDVDAYFEREVRPHVPDAWMDRTKDKAGYEVNFNLHFYKYTPPRPLEEIDADLKNAEAETGDLLQQAITTRRAVGEAGGLSSGWQEQSAKRAYSITLGKMLQHAPLSADDVEVHYLKAQHVQWGGVNLADLPTMWASPEEVESLRIAAGDLLVCEGGEVGRAAVIAKEPERPTIIQNALHLVRGRNGADVRFLLYLLRQAVDSNWIDAVCNTSTISHFTVDKFKEMRVWMPNSAHQTAIADHLDREMARLSRLETAATRAIELLKERRAALIAAAVNGSITWALKCPRP